MRGSIRSILFYPAIAGRQEICQMLPAQGTDVNAGAGRLTALHGAALFGQSEIVAWLLANGAEVNARNLQGQTPLAVAVEQGHEEIAALLRRHGGTA